MRINSSKKATIIISIVVLASLGSLFLVLARKMSLFGVASGPNHETNSIHPASISFAIDDQQSFDVKMHSDITMDENGGAGANLGTARTISLDIEGVLEIVAVAEGADIWQTLMRFSPGIKIDFAQDGRHLGERDLADTTRDLQRGMMVALAKQGHIAGFSTSSNIDRFAEQLLKQVAAGFQFNWGDSASLRNWTQRELDGSGIYQAEYHVDSESGGYIQATKAKTGYLTMSSSTAGSAAPAVRGVLNGQVKFNLDSKTGWARQIDGQESASVSVGEIPQQMVSVAKTGYSLRFVKRQLQTHANVTAWRNEVESPASSARDPKRDVSQLKTYAKERLGQT